MKENAEINTSFNLKVSVKKKKYNKKEKKEWKKAMGIEEKKK
jgi:hypothetical protein